MWVNLRLTMWVHSNTTLILLSLTTSTTYGKLKHHVKIELCGRLRVLQLFNVDRVVQNERSAVFLVGRNGFHLKQRMRKDSRVLTCDVVRVSNVKIYVVV